MAAQQMSLFNQESASQVIKINESKNEEKIRMAKIEAVQTAIKASGNYIEALQLIYENKDLTPYQHINPITKKEYHNNNVWELEISAIINNYQSFEWATFNQFSSIDHKIKKGSKSTKICVAIFNKVKKESEEKENLKFFKGGSVFNIAQTETFTPENKPTKKEDVLKLVEQSIKKDLSTPEGQKLIAETKEILKVENKLTKKIESLNKFITTTLEKLRTKTTHTRRMMAQYQSKLYEVNISEFWRDLYTGLLNKGITDTDIKMLDFLGVNSYDLVSIRFNSDRHFEYTNNKPYSIRNKKESEIKEIEKAYNWIESNLKVNPEAAKAKKIDEAERKAKNLHGVIDGFHSTPKELAKDLIRIAEIINNETILEPSAGIGGIADQVMEEIKENNLKNVQLDTCELSSTLREVLELKDYNIIGKDFLKLEPNAIYDTVIMNPPFENGLDIEHIQHAFKFLKNGGKLVSVMSASTMTKTQKKFIEFREFLDQYTYYTRKVDAGAFKESRTMVSSEILILNKDN